MMLRVSGKELESVSLSPAEVSALLEVPERRVRKEIEHGLLPSPPVDFQAAVYLWVVHSLNDLEPSVEWRRLSGRGRIISRVVVHDSPTSSLIPGQPFNVAAIALDEEPEVIMLSHLPGTPVDQVPIGSAVEVIFETTSATGQKVPEWRVIG